MQAVLCRSNGTRIAPHGILCWLIPVSFRKPQCDALAFCFLDKVCNLIPELGMQIGRAESRQIIRADLPLSRRGIFPILRHVRHLHAWLSYFFSYEAVLLRIR